MVIEREEWWAWRFPHKTNVPTLSWTQTTCEIFQSRIDRHHRYSKEGMGIKK